MVGMLQEIESLGKESTALVLDSGILQPPREIREKMGLASRGTRRFTWHVSGKETIEDLIITPVGLSAWSHHLI